MPANSRWDLIQRYRVKIVKNPGNGRLNNLNDLVLNVLILDVCNNTASASQFTSSSRIECSI